MSAGMNSSQASSFPFGQKIVWKPDPEWMASSNIQRFMARHGIPDYDSLYQRSVADWRWFWEAVLEDLNIEFYRPYSQIVDLSRGLPFARWCVDGEMNIVHNCLDKWIGTATESRPALIWEGEEGDTVSLTYGELNDSVGQCAAVLQNLGLKKGNVVGLFMPMIPELAVAFLAVIKLGGIVLPLFSGYGPEAVATRLADAGARMLICADGFRRRGRPVLMKPVVDEALQRSHFVERVIVVRRLASDEVAWQEGRDQWWHDLVPTSASRPETVRTGAEDVALLLYTSGTTGRPKGVVHSHCGFPIKAAVDMYYPMDVKPGDVMYWMTDMGWMMGPWEVFGCLLIGATMVFYDGAPDYPAVDRVWALVEDHRVTHLGVSPTLIRSLMAHGEAPVRRHDLSSLRAVGSTGSPWDPESWMWLFETALDRKKPILNYSGGTEISGGIVCGNFFKPLKPCAFSGPVLGMDADVVDEHGRPVRRQVGELVLRTPWIGMTRGFWNDEERYLKTYWSRFPNLWVHGDFAAIDEDGLWYILGRSDDTIKVAGKRLGPAEVEAILNAHPDVVESAAIGVPHPVKDNEIIAFCVLRPERQPDERLRKDLMERVAAELGKPLQPADIRFVTALPKTRNAKVMHRVIRAIYLNQDPGDLSSLEDPDTLEAIRNSR